MYWWKEYWNRLNLFQETFKYKLSFSGFLYRQKTNIEKVKGYLTCQMSNLSLVYSSGESKSKWREGIQNH